MKIVAYVHLYQPTHNAGAEVMLHQILKTLVEDYGHEAKVICRDPGVESYDGIDLYDPNDERIPQIFQWADVVFTHLDFTQKAIRWANRIKKPIVHLIHNDRQVTFNQLDRYNAHLLITNSKWINDATPKIFNKTIVYPPTNPKEYVVESTGDAITLLNMNEAKGGKIFWELARIMTDRKFIGVKGAYGEQIGYDKKLPNVTIYENNPDVKKIYKQSRLVIMPSAYESWGRVGMEAAASGIPVIANPTPGLTESLGSAGVYANYYSVADYVEAILKLDDPKVYKKHSDALKKRSKDVYAEYLQQIEELDEALRKLPKHTTPRR